MGRPPGLQSILVRDVEWRLRPQRAWCETGTTGPEEHQRACPPQTPGLGAWGAGGGGGELRITPATLGAAGVRDWKPAGVLQGADSSDRPRSRGAVPWDATARLSPCSQAHEATGPPATPAVRFPCLDGECPHGCFLAFSFFSTPQPRGRPPAHCSPLEAVLGQSERSRHRAARVAAKRAGVRPDRRVSCWGQPSSGRSVALPSTTHTEMSFT